MRHDSTPGPEAVAVLATPPERTANPAVSRRELIVVAVLTLAFLGLLVLWSLLTPIYGAPDEHAHMNSGVRLTQELSWPEPGDARMYGMVAAARDEAGVPAAERSTFAELAADVPGTGGVDQMTQHPPLYYAFAAVVLQSIGFMDLRADVALVGLRLAGLIFAAPLPLLVWASTRRITRSPRAAVVGAAALLAVPQLAQILASVSNDGLTILLCSIVVWLGTRVMTGDARWRIVIALGVALGLALLTKGTALPFIPFAAVTLIVWPRGSTVGRRVLRAGSSLAIAFFIGGWWWLRNLLLFGDLQPSGLAGIRDTVPWEPGTSPDVIAYLDRMWTRMTGSFWGNFGWLEYPLPQLLTDVLSVIALSVVVVYAFRRGPVRWQVVVLASLPALVLVLLFVNTWRHYVRTQQFAGLQGRYLFVTIVALVVVSAVAWRRFIVPAQRRTVGVALVGLAAVVAAAGLLRAYIGEYEASQYRLSLDGLRAFAAMTPGGAPAIGLAGGAAVVVCAFALVLTIRWIRGRDSATTAAAADEERAQPASTPA
ncbi:DUF2142 domain-containing protein [Microbacterium sp. CFBP9034]|uniref:DUF2142 domain-containing protein n=1 Tax=Microbacterium sp. CFBP9034 TaxID=3096540 RepID=UPI002A69963F|nr:DUF2142 domain-containing protein [Microbacterium sp. CFBP9034]MDY0909010.1 DUF2142 domain-containing protein [Microbacterium sp. CFBP9034]